MYEFTFSNLWVWSEFLLNSLMISPSAIEDERSGLKMEINSDFKKFTEAKIDDDANSLASFLVVF